MIRIETERLIIRNFTIKDEEHVYEQIMKFQKSEFVFMEWQWPSERSKYAEIIQNFISTDDYLAVEQKLKNKFIGWFAIGKNEDGSNNFGYNIHIDFHGQGFATEAGNALLDHMFNELQIETIVTGTGLRNKPSVHLLEKLGFRKISEEKENFHTDEDGNPIEFLGGHFKLTKEQWTAKNT
ncbi:MAG: GNAT family N-acetyltransferase [Promethearchaeota archaeon]